MEIPPDTTDTIGIEPTGSPGFDYHSDLTYIRLRLLEVRYEMINITETKGNLYSLDIPAPLIQGDYKIFVPKGEKIGGGAYNLTVIEEVKNETRAYMIADRFMNAAIKETTNNWRIMSKQISSTDDSWDVFLETKYTWCPAPSMGTTVFDLDNCVDNTVTGHYIIDKKTGQIIG